MKTGLSVDVASETRRYGAKIGAARACTRNADGVAGGDRGFDSLMSDVYVLMSYDR